MTITRGSASNSKWSLFANIPTTTATTNTMTADEKSHSASYSSSFDRSTGRSYSSGDPGGDHDDPVGVNQFIHSSFASFAPATTQSRPANTVTGTTTAAVNPNSSSSEMNPANSNTAPTTGAAATTTNDRNDSDTKNNQENPNQASIASSTSSSSSSLLSPSTSSVELSTHHQLTESNLTRMTAKSHTQNHSTRRSSPRRISIRHILFMIVLIISLGFITLFIQGISHLLSYRRNFGDAIIPKAPSHGVIVAYSENYPRIEYDVVANGGSTSSSSSKYSIEEEDNWNKNYMFKAFHSSRKGNEYEQQQQEREGLKLPQRQPPLRLLVIGDSLARGVGQANNCYPVLPQSIAKHLSRHMNNRPVYWTTMAKPGASTKWMSELVGEDINQIKKLRKQRREEHLGVTTKMTGDNHHCIESAISHDEEMMMMGPILNSSSTSTTTTATSVSSTPYVSFQEFQDRHTSSSKSIYSITKDEWVSNLEYHVQLYAQNRFANYDMVVVMSGLNDIKRILVPFLLDDEVINKDDDDEVSKDDNQQDHIIGSERNERGFAADMQRLIELLNMGQALENMDYDHHLKKTSFHQGVSQDEIERIYLLSSQELELEEGKDGHRKEQQERPKPPMIVFPRFPTHVNPVKMGTLLKRFAIYFSTIMDKVKSRIADQYDNVISPDSAFEEFAREYVSREKKDANNFSPKDDVPKFVTNEKEIMVNLIDVSIEECQKVESDMSRFYSLRNAADFCVDSPFGILFAPDGLHPSDYGYDYFGELLAKDIIERWGHDRLSP